MSKIDETKLTLMKALKNATLTASEERIEDVVTLLDKYIDEKFEQHVLNYTHKKAKIIKS